MKRLILFTAGGLIALIAVILGLGALRSPEVRGHGSIQVDAAPQAVYDFLVNAENLPKWTTYAQSVRRVSADPPQYRLVTDGHPVSLEFFNMRPPNEFSARMKMLDGDLESEWTVRIEPEGAGSRVTSDVKLHVGEILRRSIALFLNPDTAEQATLERLKRYLEQ